MFNKITRWWSYQRGKENPWINGGALVKTIYWLGWDQRKCPIAEHVEGATIGYEYLIP